MGDWRMREFQKADADGTGDVSREELTSAIRDKFAGVDVDSLLKVFDTDQDGKISYMEFAQMTKVFSVFNKFDVDGNGLISRKELGNVLMRIDTRFNEKQLDSLLDRVGCDSDGNMDIVSFVMYVADFSDELGIKLEQTAAILARDTGPGKIVELS
eukprot:TRINITY_DN19981_c0_g1_i2.p1 TRINITY_DN19981_c0_g1~~TRINITY_DN19981_c0_g1_i2.p1  ORF type:complete len:156 (+),score=41.38 TRINITY_DN19981_c0_g1_i2:162-629(+)